MSKTITILVDKKGKKIKVETSGFEGTSCDAIHRAFEGEGATVLSDERKPEYYDGDNSNSQVSVGR